MYSLLRQKAFNHETALVNFASGLSDLKTVDTSGTRISDLIQTEFQNLGYDRVIKDRIGNVIGCMYGRNFNPTLLFISHIGAVSTDQKEYCNALAAQIYAGRLLKESFQLNGNLIVVATTALECGAVIGLQHFLGETLPSLSFRPSYALLGEPTGGNLYYGRDGWIGIELNFSSDESERLNRSMEELNSFLIRSSSRYYSDCYDNKDVIVNKPVYSQLNGCKAQIRIIHRLRHKNESIRLLNQYREIARYICKPYRTKVCSVGVSRLAIDTALGSLTVRGVSFPWRTDPFNSFFEESYLALRTAQCRSSGGVWDNSRIGSCTSGDILTNRFNIPTVGYGPGNEQFDNADTDEVEQNLRDVFFGNAVIAHRLLVPPKNFTESDSSQG